MKQGNLVQLLLCDFLIYKKGYPEILKNFIYTPKHHHDPFHIKKIITFKITLKKYTYKSEDTLTTPFHTKKNYYIYNHVKKHTHKTHRF